MKARYDEQVDALMIVTDNPGPVDNSLTEHEDDIIVTYSKDGKPLIIEILNASQILPRTPVKVSKKKRKN